MSDESTISTNEPPQDPTKAQKLSYRPTIMGHDLGHQNHSPPISQLPDDILLQIFEVATQTLEGHAVGRNDMGPSPRVRTVERALALSYSKLWARIDLTFSSERTVSQKEDKAALLSFHKALLQLERARTQHLRCYIDLPVFDHAYQNPRISSCASNGRTASEEWRCLLLWRPFDMGYLSHRLASIPLPSNARLCPNQFLRPQEAFSSPLPRHAVTRVPRLQ